MQITARYFLFFLINIGRSAYLKSIVADINMASNSAINVPNEDNMYKKVMLKTRTVEYKIFCARLSIYRINIKRIGMKNSM